MAEMGAVSAGTALLKWVCRREPKGADDNSFDAISKRPYRESMEMCWGGCTGSAAPRQCLGVQVRRTQSEKCREPCLSSSLSQQMKRWSTDNKPEEVLVVVGRFLDKSILQMQKSPHINIHDFYALLDVMHKSIQQERLLAETLPIRISASQRRHVCASTWFLKHEEQFRPLLGLLLLHYDFPL